VDLAGDKGGFTEANCRAAGENLVDKPRVIPSSLLNGLGTTNRVWKTLQYVHVRWFGRQHGGNSTEGVRQEKRRRPTPRDERAIDADSKERVG
jgi:hypothetical protein